MSAASIGSRADSLEMQAPADAASDDGGAGYQWEASDAQIAAAFGVDPAQIVRFDTNTSPRTPPQLANWLARAPLERLNEYPDATYEALTAAIAARHGVPPTSIVVGAGADELLDIAAKTCLSPGGRAVVATPTYGMYPVLSRQRAAMLVDAPRGAARDGFPLDADALVRAAAGAELVWLCDPNNPTGTAEPHGALLDLLGRLADGPGGGPVVVADEAYREFGGASLIGALGRFPRLVVVRTLSKAYGLAGIRVGYAVAQPALAARLAVVRPPGSISTLSAWIATAALADAAFASANVAAIVGERERFRAALLDAGWKVPPSVTNFLLVDADDPATADAAADRLLRRGLVPRRLGPGPLRGYLRLTVRTPEEDDRLLAALGTRPRS